MTLEQALQEGVQRCSGSDTATLDAQLLLCHVLQVERSYLYTWPERTLSPPQLADYRALTAQRANGQPVAYLLGYRDFWTFRLAVNESTLIPRPDTEVLVETCLQLPLPEDACVLDLGTGTGAIALALASEQPNWLVDAVDVQAEAVALAKKNRDALQLAHVNIYQSDWFHGVENKCYDLIVSNPPYIDANDLHLNQGDVRFEPRSALVAEAHGFADIYFIIQQAKQFLTPGGWLAFEHGFEQAEAIQACFTDAKYESIKTVQDYAGLDRVTYAQCNRQVKG